jgi:hypothetical protein
MAAPAWHAMEPASFRECTMTESGLIIETELPFHWETGSLSPSQQQANRLLLRVVNLLDVHEPEHDRTSERIEAKIDLMLHWLGSQLFGAADSHPKVRLRLSQNSIEWYDAGPVESGHEVILSLGHPAITSPLRLGARISANDGGRTLAELIFPDAEQEDAWGQWLFRLHRRAIQEARQRADAD